MADRLIHLSATLGSLALVVEVVVILVDVIGRAFGKPLYGSQDLVTMTLVIVVFGAMALCDRAGGHIAVDLLERYYPPRMNLIIDIVAALIGALIFAGLAWAIWESSKLSVMLNLSTNLLLLPKSWFQWALMGFSIVTAFALFLRAIELTLGWGDIRKDIKS